MDNTLLKSSKEITFIDLYCGIGSFHYSFQRNGFKCVMACDIYKAAKQTYKNNYGLEPLDDIRKVNPETIDYYDILCAGFPCQPFSNAGQHEGFNDIRGNMFLEIMRFIKANMPKIVILENVPGLINHDNGRTFEIIKKKLEDENYTIMYDKLKCSDYGIPQMRQRIFIIAYKNIMTHNIDKFFDLGKYKRNVTLSVYLNKNFTKNTAYTLRCGGRRSGINNRHNWDGYLVDNKEYILTIEDGLKLQGFIDFNLVGTESEKWTMLGNTIPTIFTDILAKQIIKHFEF